MRLVSRSGRPASKACTTSAKSPQYWGIARPSSKVRSRLNEVLASLADLRTLRAARPRRGGFRRRQDVDLARSLIGQAVVMQRRPMADGRRPHEGHGDLEGELDRSEVALARLKAAAVGDDEILLAMTEMSAAEGLLPSPESAATLVAAKRLAANGWIKPKESVVLFNCGTMLKHLDLIDTPDFPVLDPNAEIDYGLFA